MDSMNQQIGVQEFNGLSGSTERKIGVHLSSARFLNPC